MSSLQNLAAAVRALGAAGTAVTEPSTGIDAVLAKAQAMLEGISEANDASAAITAARQTWQRVGAQATEAAGFAVSYANSLT